MVRLLRAEGVRAEMEQAGRSLKGQLRHAGRLRAPWVVIVGEGQARVRDMREGSERSVRDAGEAVRVVVAGRANGAAGAAERIGAAGEPRPAERGRP